MVLRLGRFPSADKFLAFFYLIPPSPKRQLFVGQDRFLANTTRLFLNMAKDVFSVPIFLVVFRETLETVIIVSVLLAFLKQTLDGPERDVRTYKALRRQVRLTHFRPVFKP